MIIGYGLAATLIYLTPNALGGNAVRLGALFGGPVLAAVLLAHRPLPVGAGGGAEPAIGLAPPLRRVPPRLYMAILVVTLAGSLFWQFTASVSQIARSVGDPSTEASYFQPASHWLMEHGGQGVRIEVPPTANHWESAYLAPKFELARGWLRQLDTARDDLFYKEGALTAHSYERWLRNNAITYVALPNAPLDYSSIVEARIIRAEPPYLRERFHRDGWRIFEVSDPKPLVSSMGVGRASTVRVGHQGFALDVTQPGRFLVRVAFTPYWSIGRGSGCLLRDGNWTDRPHRPHRHLRRRRRLLPERRLERRDRRPQDLLNRQGHLPFAVSPPNGGETAKGYSASESGSSSRERIVARNSAAGAP